MSATLRSGPLLPDAAPAQLPKPDAVVAFLHANPAFLADRPELYRVLEPPRRLHGERLTDHMAAMLASERVRTRALEAEMGVAAIDGRAGHGLNIRVRLAVLALMRCQDVVEAVTQELPALLGIETCSLLSEQPDRRGVVRLPKGTVARLIGHGRDALVRPLTLEAALLHQEAAALVNRDALARVPVWTGVPTMLALGAREPAALPARQATSTLAFLGRVVAAALTR